MSRNYFAAATLLLVTICACSDTGATRSTDRSAQLPTAPTPPDANSPDSAETTMRPPWQLIGSKLDDSNVEEYLSQTSSQPEREDAPGYGVFVSLHQDGIELSADTTGTIATVIIYASGSHQYDKYSGPMPRSLTWDMTRADVEKTIGQPADHSFFRNSRTGRHQFFAEYPELDIYLNHDAESASDMQARLIDIRIKNARM